MSGLLGEFAEAGVLGLADLHVARRVARLGGEQDESVQLAFALAVRALRTGSVCVELANVGRTVVGEAEEAVDFAALPWPDPSGWLAACARSPLVARGEDGPAGRPLRLTDGLLYLDRYWRHEELVRAELRRRAVAPPPPLDADRLSAALDRLFPPTGGGPDQQRAAAEAAASGWLTVIAGGPGTGKTTTVARLLAVLCDQPGPPPRIALAAPTGKAAARLSEAVSGAAATLPAADAARLGSLQAATLHRLLRPQYGSRTRFRHNRTNRLPYDVVVVDETSMVALSLMARLVDAVRPAARLVLVGDPDQLASVEAGAVLGDLVSAPALAHRVVTLGTSWRFGGAISELAAAVRRGDPDAALAVLRSGSADVEFVEDPADLDGLRADVVGTARTITAAARAGDVAAALGALDAHRLLCGHRRGPYGVAWWAAQVESWLPREPSEGEWYPGRPLLVTANDYDVGLHNGDTGVVVRVGEEVRAAFARGGEPVLLAPTRLSTVQTVHAMTVHRGQGSQFRRVSLILPPADSPLLTRELLYTAITRAESGLRILGTAEAVEAAVRRPITRASGLVRRLVR